MAAQQKTVGKAKPQITERGADTITATNTHKEDEALQFLRKQVVGDEAAYVDEKKLLRKIDFMMIPLMWCCYFLEYLDKSLLNYATVMGLRTQTHVTTSEFANLSMLFYVAFLAFEFPHGYLMQRFPAAKYLGTMVTCWGIVLACTSACNDYGSLVAVRFLLGMFESTISPSLIIITAMWYKRHEQPSRIGIWYTGVGCGQIVGGLISFGFQHYHGRAFVSWQIMFLVVGLVTIVVGCLVILLLPDNPMSCRRLSHAEKVIAVERVRENNTGIENKKFKPHQVLEAMRDPQVWLLFLITLTMSVPNGAVSSFQSILISNFGFSHEVTALLQIPSGFISLSSCLAGTWFAGRFNARGAGIIIWSAIGGILGGGLMAFLSKENKAGQLVGNYFTQVFGSALPCAYAWAGGNLAGHTKKVTMNAILLIGFCIGNIIGPETFREADAPDFTPAKITIVAMDASAIFLTILLLIYYKWENYRRDRIGQEHQPDIEFSDLTDKENQELRYRY